MMEYADLHMHSCLSDGDKSPKELVCVAEKRNISVMALTDHDCIDGLEQAKNEAKIRNIIFIPGIELSCYDEKDTHILGYNISSDNEELKQMLYSLQESRLSRMKKIIDGLSKAGFGITMDDVKKHCCGKVMGRPHVAAALIEKGYGKNVRDVFKKYIGTGCKYYVPYKKMDVSEGIDIIHKAGGIAVLAHPKLLRYNHEEFTELLTRYKAMGLDGVEVYYPCHYAEHVNLFLELSKKLKLFATCGGDYHNDFDKTKNNMGFKTSLPGIKETLELLIEGAAKK